MKSYMTCKGIAVVFLLAALTLWVPVFGCTGGTGGTGETGVASGTSETGAGSTSSVSESGAAVAPANLSATPADGQVTLSWDAVSGATSYTLYWANAAGVTKQSGAIPTVTSPYAHTGLTNGTTYYYAMTASNARGEGELSNEVSALPQAGLIAAPRNVKAVAGNRLVGISWDPVDGAKSYNVYWSQTAGVVSDPNKMIDTPYTSANHMILQNGQTYYYRVAAVDAKGEGALSAEVSATPYINGSLTVKIDLSSTTNGNLGSAVAIDKGHVLIGIPNDNTAGNQTGAVVFFEQTDSYWNWGSPKMNAHVVQAYENFGWSVAVSGDYAIVGIPNRDSIMTKDVGAAEIYKRTNGQWNYYATVMADAADQIQGEFFGLAVAIDGNYAAVGTWGDDGKGQDAGAVYLFDLTTATLIQKITASDAGKDNMFGSSVAINGTTLIVGAIGKTVGGFNYAGEVYVYQIGAPIKEVKILKASDPADHAWFGSSVALSKDYAIIGAPMKSGLSMKGDAYVFDTKTWTEVKRLGPADLADGDRYGVSVGISDQYAVVGAPWRNTGIVEAGQAYLYKVGTWEEVTKFMAYDAEAKDHLGKAAAISGDVTLVGAPDKNGGFGAVYLY